MWVQNTVKLVLSTLNKNKILESIYNIQKNKAIRIPNYYEKK